MPWKCLNFSINPIAENAMNIPVWPLLQRFISGRKPWINVLIYKLYVKRCICPGSSTYAMQAGIFTQPTRLKKKERYHEPFNQTF